MRETDDEWSDALLRQDRQSAPAGADPARHADRAIAADRRRLRLLTGLTVALWSVAVLLVLAMVAMFYLFVAPRIQRDADDVGQPLHSVVTYVIGAGAAVIGIAVVVLALATMTTLLLVSASRRATLRHVSAGLAEVGEQLRQIRQQMTAGRGPDRGGGSAPDAEGGA